jgi:hypothetical protein
LHRLLCIQGCSILRGVHLTGGLHVVALFSLPRWRPLSKWTPSEFRKLNNTASY